MVATTSDTPSTVVLVLANEKSRHRAKYKAALPLKGGTMLEFAVTLGINLNIGPVLVVLGKRLAKPSHLENKSLSFLKDQSTVQNHYTAIATGLYELQEKQALPQRVLAITCMHPYLTIGHLNKLLKRHSKEDNVDMVLSMYGNDVHLPAVISKRVFSEFHVDSKKKDLDEILHAKKYSIVSVMLPNGTIDIDSREEYLDRLGE